MYNNVNMEHKSNIDKIDELHYNSLKNKSLLKILQDIHTSNSHAPNNDYITSIYTYLLIAHEAPSLGQTLLHMHFLLYYLASYMPHMGSYHIHLTHIFPHSLPWIL